MKKSLLFAVLYSVFGLIFPSLLFSQDIHVNCATVNPCTLTPAGGIAWSQSNPTWIFTPSNPASSILIYVHNNNGTSAHVATIKVFQTGFARTTAPTLTANADLWVQDAVTLNSTASASCNSVAANTPGTPGASGVGTCYVVSMYAAQVAIQVTNTGVQAGSPDTYDLSIVQQPGYIGGPQPGADSSAGGGLQFAAGNNLTDGTVTAGPTSFRALACEGISPLPQGTLINPCVTAFGQMLFGVANLERLRSYFNVNDGGGQIGILAAGEVLDNGGTLAARAKSASSANATVSSTPGNMLSGIGVTTAPASWTVPVQATTASQCSASLVAQATTRHCAVGITACLVATAAQSQLFVNLRDGATGAGTVKWNGVIAGTIGTGDCVVQEFEAGPVCGTLNTAMTLELSAVTAATNGCAVTLRGYDIQ